MSEDFPFDKLKHGNFFQVKYNDGNRIANRAFQIYDKDANKELSLREVKGMIKNIYKGIEPRKKISDIEMKAFISVLDKRKTGKIRDQDFQELVEEYFINHNKKGALDYQTANPEHFNLSTQKSKDISISNIKSNLITIGTKRFGKAFIDSQLINCRELFDRHNHNKDSKLEYSEIFTIFEEIYKKIYFHSSKEKLHPDDLKRLLERMNYDGDGKIGFEEFEIFYLNGILGS